MFRTCKICNIEKEIKNFHKCNGGKNYRRMCGTCRTQRAKDYMLKYYNKKLDASGKKRKNRTGKIKFFEGSNLVN